MLNLLMGLVPRKRGNLGLGGTSSPIGFRYEASNQIAATTWGGWVANQPFPVFKPNHRLYRLHHYLYGYLDYTMARTQCERWGYGLYVGSTRAIDYIADSRLENPQTDFGRLIKLAADEPDKYPVAAAVRQPFPTIQQAPTAYMTFSDGSRGGWSPEATDSDLNLAATQKTDPVKALVDRGVRVAVCYDGGEEAISSSKASTGDTVWGRDATVLAAKGTRSWYDYISDKASQLHGRCRDALAALVPNRQVYVYYPCVAPPYSNVPDWPSSTLDYYYMRRASDIPSGSWYFRDAFATGAGMSNPAWVDRAFVDQLTHFSGSVTEQIANYNQPHSYNFVCGGFRKTYGTGIEADWFLGLRSYEGFLKCTYALGQLGGVASYFGADAADDLIFGINYYPAYDPLHPPHWVSQMLALGRVHALFSWVDDFILDGDLLPGDGQHRIKGGLPSMEYFAKVSRGGFIVRDESIRCFARKLRNANRWLIVCTVAERLDGTDGFNTEIRVDTIPGLPAMSLLARPQGSVYVAELQPSGAVKLTQLDKAAPHPLNKPVFVRYDPAGAGKLRLYFHAPRFLETGTTIPPTDFSVQGITVTAASVAPETVEYGVVELSYTGTLAPQAILSYSGASLLDTDGNSVEPFSTGASA